MRGAWAACACAAGGAYDVGYDQCEEDSANIPLQGLFGRVVWELYIGKERPENVSENVVAADQQNWDQEPYHALVQIDHRKRGLYHCDQDDQMRPAEQLELVAVVLSLDCAEVDRYADQVEQETENVVVVDVDCEYQVLRCILVELFLEELPVKEGDGNYQQVKVDLLVPEQLFFSVLVRLELVDLQEYAC